MDSDIKLILQRLNRIIHILEHDIYSSQKQEIDDYRDWEKLI